MDLEEVIAIAFQNLLNNLSVQHRAMLFDSPNLIRHRPWSVLFKEHLKEAMQDCWRMDFTAKKSKKRKDKPESVTSHAVYLKRLKSTDAIIKGFDK